MSRTDNIEAEAADKCCTSRNDDRPEHEEECKRRAAELRDEILFRQPESRHLGDCPICCVPFPLDRQKFTLTGCCSKLIC